MVLVVAFAGGHEALDVGVMFSVYPDTTHGVMDGREDFHRHLTRILTYEIIVHFEDTAELAFQVISRNMGQIQIYTVRVGHAKAHVYNYLIDSTGGNVTRYEVAVCRIHIFEEVPAFFFARLGVLAIYPNTAAFTTAGFGHQTVLIGTRDSRRMNLQEFGVADFCALLVNSGYSGTIADSGRRAAAIYLARAASSQNYYVSRESHDFVGVHVLGNDTTANAVFVLDDFDEFPELIFLNAAFNFPTANLLVESVEELLARRGTGKYGTFVLLATEVTEVKHAFRRTGERHAHAVKHVHEFRSCLNHAFNSQLVSQEVTAVYRVIEMFIDGVMLTLGVHAGIHAALCTQGMGAFNRAIREEVNLTAVFTDFQRSHEARKAAAYDNNLLFRFISH